MATVRDNPYIELYEQLSIPERLEPANIAAMLEEHKLAKEEPVKIKVSSAKPEKPVRLAERKPEEADTEIRNITVSGSKRKTSAAFRSAASIAACAALALGIAGYVNIGKEPELPEQVQSGGSYASDYDDIHKSFEKYYIDDAGKTLDSAIEDIEHSYNESTNDAVSENAVTEPSAPESDESIAPDVSGAPANPEQPNSSAPAPEGDDPIEAPMPPNTEIPSEQVDELLPLPESDAVYDDGIKFGNGFILVPDSNVLRIISTASRGIEYHANIFPLYEEGSAKTLAGYFVDGTKAVTVYSVISGGEAVSDPLYGDGNYYETASGTRSSVEVCIYDIMNGEAVLSSSTVQSGSLIDMSFVNGSLYLVTAYNDYRTEPIIGVDDLESYVPSYTLNGVKYYIEPSDIMIPDYVSNTDYTVISGINIDGTVSVKAVLGYEDRVILRNGAVYLLGYENYGGSDCTTVRVFGLSGGNVAYAGAVDIEGVALGGAGVSTFDNAIAVTTVRETESGYVTTLGIYGATMELIARANIPGALTTAKREGDCIYLSGSKSGCGIDLSNLSAPTVIETAPKKDKAEGLVPFEDGYVTLTQRPSGEILLSKLYKDETGELRLAYSETVTAEPTAHSKAVENNGLLFVSGDVIGLPYGYYDGLDNTYRYALYRSTGAGFEFMGQIEFHEVDDAFEPERAILSGGMLYVFSEGRVNSVIVSDSVTLVGTADIVPSAYSGH